MQYVLKARKRDRWGVQKVLPMPENAPASLANVRDGKLVVPANWQLVEVPGIELCAFRHFTGLTVIVSEEVHHGCEDRWLHVLVTHSAYIPTWNDMVMVKKLFIGEHREAVQLHPPKDEYVNFCENCLHLWCNLNRRVMPDSVSA